MLTGGRGKFEAGAVLGTELGLVMDPGPDFGGDEEKGIGDEGTEDVDEVDAAAGSERLDEFDPCDPTMGANTMFAMDDGMAEGGAIPDWVVGGGASRGVVFVKLACCCGCCCVCCG